MDMQYLISCWEGVRRGLIETVDKFDDQDLDFKPFATSWSARQIMLHIAREENGEFNYGITQTLPEFPPDYQSLEYPTRASIQTVLNSVHSQSIEYLKALDDKALNSVINTPWGANYRLLEMLDHLIEHEIHHRAELSLILGMLGREGFNA